VGSPTLTRLPASRSSTIFRFAVVFVLGVLSPLLFSPFDLAPWWAQPLALLLLLLVAVGVSGFQAPQRGFSVLATLLVLAAFGGLFLWLRALVAAAGPAATATIEARQAAAQWGILAALLMPMLVGTAAALVAQREPSGIQALAGAELGWLGAALSNVGVTWLGPTLNPTVQTPELSTSVILIAVLSVVGFVVALLGGLLGWGLRQIAFKAP
jgi:hypothetical protein